MCSELAHEMLSHPKLTYNIIVTTITSTQIVCDQFESFYREIRSLIPKLPILQPSISEKLATVRIIVQTTQHLVQFYEVILPIY